MIGKIISERVTNFTGVKSYAMNVWGYPKKMKVAEIGVNLYQFRFEDKRDMERILNGGPWLIDNQILVLKEWIEGIEECKDAFNKGLLWIQVWNLPLHWMSKETGKKVGSVFGEVKKIIIPETRRKEGKHLKMLVEVDITEPLMKGTFVKCNGVSRQLQFKYMMCPDFCYNCCIIGHGERSCFNRINVGGGVSKQQYSA